MKGSRSDQPLVIVSPSGQIASYFESSAEAARLLSVNRSCINRALKTGCFYLHRKWVYEEEYRKMWMAGRHHEYSYNYAEYKSSASKQAHQHRTEEQKQATRKILSEKAKQVYAEKSVTHPLCVR